VVDVPDALGGQHAMASAKDLSSNTAVVIIDMLNEYLDPKGKVYCEKCSSIIPAMNRVIDFAEQQGLLIVFNNTELTSTTDPLVRKWGLHAEKGTWGCRLYPAVKQPSAAVTVPKKNYNGFFDTSLDEVLKSHGVGRVAICGIHTHVCVLITATAAFEHGYDVDVLIDCVTTGYQPNHDTRLRYFGTHIGRGISSEEWMAELTKR